MSVSRVHHCPGQIKVAEGRLEPPAEKCRCRKFVSIVKATRMVKEGEASWLIKGRRTETVEITCTLCAGDETVKNCAQCRGKRTIFSPQVIEEYGEDIVLVSRHPADKKEKKRSSALAAKTPRVATIESEHIELAYVEGNREAQERIEEYGRMIQEARYFLGPKKCNHDPKFMCSRCGLEGDIPVIGLEPADDYLKAEGRRYDFGRTV